VQLSIEATPGDSVRTIWRNFAVIFAASIPLTAITITVASLMQTPIGYIRQPVLFAVTFLAISAVLAALLWRTRHARALRHGVVGVTCVAAYIGILCTGVVINVDLREASTKVADIERARLFIPDGEVLYSLGPVDHGFAFYYRDPIDKTPWPADGERLPDEVNYFVFQAYDEQGDTAFDFAWEPLAFVDSSSTKSNDASRLVVVAHKLKGDSDGRATLDIVRERYLRMQALASVAGDELKQ
jgi:hypothetical protein